MIAGDLQSDDLSGRLGTRHRNGLPSTYGSIALFALLGYHRHCLNATHSYLCNAIMTDSLTRLKDAKGRRVPWFEIAQTIRLGLRKEGETSDGRGFLARAADATGYSANLLGRYVAALEFAVGLESEGLASIEQLAKTSFAAIESLKRIWRIDPAQGRKLLKPLLNGDISVAGLRKVLGTTQSTSAVMQNRSRARRYREERKLAILDAIETSHIRALTGAATTKFVCLKGHLDPYLSPDAIAIGERHGRLMWVDGIDVREFSPFASATLADDLVGRSALYAPFFRHYWLVLGPTRKGTEHRLRQALARFDLVNVGIAVVEPNDRSLRVVVHPNTARATPNRQRDLIRILEGRKWRDL
jgi:hypothetical protein